jgi:hypothetical protein
MKDVNDNQTADLLPLNRRRGRPSTGKALPGAVRQAKYRASKAAVTVTVTFSRDDIPALKLLLANPNPSLEIDQDTQERLIAAVFNTALIQYRNKEQGR